MRRLLAALALTGLVATGGVVTAPPASAHWRMISTHYLLRHLGPTIREHYRGYDRDKFASDWAYQGYGCDTRDIVLIRDAYRTPLYTGDCELVDGQWYSPYDGIWTYDPGTLQIDHVVPVAEAWQSGAWRWTHRERNRYYNDLGYRRTLAAVSAHSNESKGDSEPQDWMPPKLSFRCTYVAWWVAIKWRWHLRVNYIERVFLWNVLHRCGWPMVIKPWQVRQ